MYELHEDQLPSNWRYETARSLLIALGDLCARQADEGDIRSAIDEELWEICEGLVDAYNGARWEWFTEDGWVYAEDVVEAIRAGDSSARSNPAGPGTAAGQACRALSSFGSSSDGRAGSTRCDQTGGRTPSTEKSFAPGGAAHA
jgi:hypothetical protein